MPIAGRPKKHALVVTDDERIELERLAKRMRVNRAVVTGLRFGWGDAAEKSREGWAN